LHSFAEALIELHLRAREPELQVGALMNAWEPDGRNSLLYGQDTLQLPILTAKIYTVLD